MLRSLRNLAGHRLEPFFDDIKPRDNHAVHRDKCKNKYLRRLHCVVYPSCKPHNQSFFFIIISRFVNTKSACITRCFIFSWSRIQNWDSMTHSAASLGARPFPIRNSIILKLSSSERGFRASGHSFKGAKTSPLIILNSSILLSTTSCRVR